MEDLKLYITRDENNDLFLNLDRPKKSQNKWQVKDLSKTLILDNKLFTEVKWEDEEPLELIIKTTPTQAVQNVFFKTINFMLSDDYKERFIAEYRQLVIRMEKLEFFINRIKAFDCCTNCDGVEVNVPKHDCSIGLLQDQLDTMERYAKILRLRAVIEKVNLKNL